MSSLSHVLFALRALLVDRRRLTLENIALRQQLTVLRRSVKRPKLEDRDRIFWIGMVRALDTWRETLLIVKPETVVARADARDPHTAMLVAIGGVVEPAAEQLRLDTLVGEPLEDLEQVQLGATREWVGVTALVEHKHAKRSGRTLHAATPASCPSRRACHDAARSPKINPFSDRPIRSSLFHVLLRLHRLVASGNMQDTTNFGESHVDAKKLHVPVVRCTLAAVRCVQPLDERHVAHDLAHMP